MTTRLNKHTLSLSHCQRMTKHWPLVTCTENLVKFGMRFLRNTRGQNADKLIIVLQTSFMNGPWQEFCWLAWWMQTQWRVATEVCDTWPVSCQTSDYFPSRRTWLVPNCTAWCQRHVCEWLAQGPHSRVAESQLVTPKSQAKYLNQYTTRPHCGN